MIARRHEFGLQGKATLGQDTHGAKRDREEADASALQLAIALAQMFTGPVMDRLPPIRQAEGRVDWSESGAASSTKVRLSSSLNTTWVSVVRSRSTQSLVGRFGDPARSIPATTREAFVAI